MSSESEPKLKRIKTEDFMLLSSSTCQHFVSRKKRLCKMTVAKGQQYCGEHLPLEKVDCKEANLKYCKSRRIPCPLDSKHTVYAWNLDKHLKICNAKAKDLEEYIIPGLNIGPEEEEVEDFSNIKLSDLDYNVLNDIIDKINYLYARYVEYTIDELILDHIAMKEEIDNPLYGPETLKHLLQTSSILGYLKHYELLKEKTSYIEFGAGKGQVSYWLAQIIKDYANSNVLLIDKASHRHKKDNKIVDRDAVHRIRADIADLNLKNLEAIKESKHIVGVSKHLCGAATDFALRCIINGNESIKTNGFVIALCCHHRCTWRSFVGRQFLIDNQITKKDFVIITKMVGWAICGSGMSREKQKELENRKQGDDLIGIDTERDNNKIKLSRDIREEVGMKCKRLLDFGRLSYLKEKGYTCDLKYYVNSNITLENVCLVGKLNE